VGKIKEKDDMRRRSKFLQSRNLEERQYQSCECWTIFYFPFYFIYIYIYFLSLFYLELGWNITLGGEMA